MPSGNQPASDQRVTDAIEGLEASFGDRIYFLALREMRSPAHAEDIRNETLLRVIEALRGGKVQTLDSIGAFVAGVTRNVIREHIRKNPPAADLIPDLGHHPQFPVDHTERWALRTTLQRLNPREQQVIKLVFYDEKSREEIATQLGIAPERVRLAKSRALQTFREIYHRVTRANKEPKR